jgi:hypothetical protein
MKMAWLIVMPCMPMLELVDINRFEGYPENITGQPSKPLKNVDFVSL